MSLVPMRAESVSIQAYQGCDYGGAPSNTHQLDGISVVPELRTTQALPEEEMRDIEETIAFDMQYCQHYDPSGVTMIGGKEPHGHCKAGVVYLDQFGRAPKDDPNSMVSGSYYESAGIFGRICCTSGNERTEAEQIAACPKWLRRTREQGEARADKLDQLMNRMRIVGAVVGPWRTWSKANRVAKQEVIECPICKGKLHLSQAAYNGHVWGKCETDGCANWME